MSSAWGASWGLAWGNAWGALEEYQPTNGAGFARLDRGHYKYRLKLDDKELKALEAAANKSIKPDQLKTELKQMGVAYSDKLKEAFIEIVSILRAEKLAQEEDENIAQIIAALL